LIEIKDGHVKMMSVVDYLMKMGARETVALLAARVLVESANYDVAIQELDEAMRAAVAGIELARAQQQRSDARNHEPPN